MTQAASIPRQRRAYSGPLLISLILTGLLGGCTPATPAPATHQRLQGQYADTTVTLDLPATVRVMEPVPLTVTLTDATGTPVADALVTIRLEMPGMAMGQQNLWAAPQPAGRYTATALYTMAGTWTMVVEVRQSLATWTTSWPLQVTAPPGGLAPDEKRPEPGAR